MHFALKYAITNLYYYPTIAARGDISFDNWHGISSLSGFDDFYGSDNFIGSIQTQTVVEQSQELVCHSESIEIIQQRLLVIQEMAKRYAIAYLFRLIRC
jgi:hypothetical protein